MTTVDASSAFYEGVREETNADIGALAFSRTKQVDRDERATRVFDAKWRTIGIDKQALDGQVADKIERRVTDEISELSFAKLAVFLDNEVQRAVQERDRLKRELAKNDVAFRNANQLKDTRREYDINRPDALRLEQPLRTLDATAAERDAALGVSSAQVFEGEDATAAARRMAQLRQQRQWVEQQVAEKRHRSKLQVDEELSFAALLAAQDAFSVSLERDEKVDAKARTKAASDGNVELAKLKTARDAAWKAAQHEADESEIAMLNSSAFLTEHPSAGVSSFQSHRVRPDHYKGHTDAERFEYAAFQASQREENAARRAMEAAAEMERCRKDEAIRRQLQINAQDKEDFMAEQARQMAAVRITQVTEKGERDANATAHVKAHGYAPEFFSRFGRDRR